MADDHDRAVIGIERLHQSFTRIDVQMVRWFIEDQHMRRIAGDQRQCQPRPLTARQFANQRCRLVPRKAEPPQLRANGGGRCALHHPRHMFERGIVAVKFLDLVLREITNAHLARHGDPALHCRQLRGEQAGKRGLAIAVAPQQRDTVVRIEPEIEFPQNRCRSVAHRRHIERDEWRLQRIGTGELK